MTEGPARAVVFGCAGQIGAALMESAPSGWSVQGFDRAGADITDPRAVARALDQGCAVVVNAAAYTAVDRAETQPAAALAANRDGAGHVAAAAAAAGAAVVHLSTDYVFDGTKAGPYREDDPVAPLGVYGRSKAAGEEAVRGACARHVILRTARVFGPRGGNFVATMLRLARERPALAVVADQIGCPTPAGAVAAAIWRIAERLRASDAPFGTFHFAGQPPVSWYGFAEAIFAVAAALGGPAPRLDPVPAAAFAAPAPRPRNAALDCSRLARTFGIDAPSWRPALNGCVEALLRPTGGDDA